MSREYMREYYHKNKTEIVCSFCYKTYTCKSSLVKHQGRSFKCAIQRINNTFSGFTEEDIRIRDNLHKLETADGLKILQRLANKYKDLNTKWLQGKTDIDIYTMSTDLEKRIALLVDLLVHIHTECKKIEDDPDQWHFHKCSSVALMHILWKNMG